MFGPNRMYYASTPPKKKFQMHKQKSSPPVITCFSSVIQINLIVFHMIFRYLPGVQDRVFTDPLCP